MPLPPSHYYELYSDVNVSGGTAPRPPPPPSDAYAMFGCPFSAADDAAIVQSLESQGLQRLHPPGGSGAGAGGSQLDRKRELQKLNQSVLVNFLDLLDLIIRAPESNKREEKVTHWDDLILHSLTIATD